MIFKKKTTFGKEPDLNLDDLSLDMGDLGQGSSTKKLDKRKPILKVTGNVAKGAAGHLTSESFIRGTLGRMLPEGYATAIDTGYEIRDTFSQLYNTASQELRKNGPAAAKIVERLLPKTQKLPKSVQDRLNRFVSMHKSSGNNFNPDDNEMRVAMAELETVNIQERQRERMEDKVDRGLQRNIESRRFLASTKILASMDARLANLNAYNDQIMTRYQRRSLELQYRQYFATRDMLKLHTREMAQTRQLLEAVVHNTGLPDGVKSKMREKYGEGLRERLSASSQQAIVGYTSNFFRNLRERAIGGIKNFGSGMAGGLDGLNMSADMMDMMRASGMDVSGESQKAAGGVIASILANILSVGMSGSFRRSGRTAQLGAKLGRIAGTIPDRLNQWASSPTMDMGWKGTLQQMLKDGVHRHQQSKWLGSSFIQNAGDAGMFTKKTQRSIEEIMPGYLARILGELQIMRTGNAEMATPVWSDDKGRFVTSTLADRTKSTHAKIFNNRQAQFGREQVKAYVDDLTAGATLSPGARHAMESALTRAVISGTAPKVTDLMRNSQKLGIDPAYAREIAKAVRGRFRTNGVTDEVTLGHFTRKYQALRSTVPDVRNQVAARLELGQYDELHRLGLLDETDDGYTLNYDKAIEHMVGGQEGSARVSPGSRQYSEYMGSEYGGMGSAVISDTRINLYRKGMTVPTIEGAKVLRGGYLNAKTLQPIRLMREVLDGVLDGTTRQIIVTADQARGLVTSSGESFPDFLARSQSKRGKLDKAMDWVNGKVRGVADKADAFFTEGKGSQYFGRPGRVARRKAAAQARDRASSVMDHLAAKSASMATSSMRSAKAAMDEAAKSPYVERAKERISSLWKRAVQANRYAISLYKNGQLVPTIEAEALRAGEYVSAVTGKVITDLRQLAEGVKDKRGEWVATAEEVATNLYSPAGKAFETMMDEIQTAAEHHGVPTTPQAASAAVERTKAQVASHAAAAVQAASSKAQSSVVSPVAAAIQQAQAAQSGQPVPTDISASIDPLIELVREFKEGNLQHLAEILAVVANRDYTQPGPGTPGPYANTKFGILGKWGGAAARGATSLGSKFAGMYGRYVKGVFGLQGRILGGAARGVGSLFVKPKNHMGKVPSDVYVTGEKEPRLTKGKMMAGDYFTEDGKPIRCPADIKGIVKDAEGNTPIDLDDLRKGLHDGQGHSVVAHLTRALWNGALGLGRLYGKAFMLPIKIVQHVGDFAKKVMLAARVIADVYTADDLDTPKLRAFGMRAGHYIDKKTRKPVRDVQDIRGPVLNIAKDPPEMALSAEDIDKGLVDYRGRPFKVKQGMLSNLVQGIFSGGGRALGGIARLLGNATRAGANLAALPFRLMSGLFGKKGLGGVSLFGRTSDEKTHDLLKEVLRLLDARMPESEHYRSGSWQDIMKKRGAARDKAAGGASKADPQKSLWASLMDRLRGDHDHDEEDDDHDGGGDTYINENGERVPRTNNGKDARGRKRGGWRRKADAWKKRRDRAAGGRGGERTGMGSRVGKKGWWGRLGERVGGVAKTARMGKLSWLGRGLGAAKGLGLGLAASYGLGKIADWAGHDSVTGKVADGASTAAGIYGTVAPIASMLGFDVGLGALAAGAGTAAGAIGSGLATVGGALASIISAPVVAIGAAVTAAGVGIYYGTKYYGLKKSDPIRKYRMAQYGVDMGRNVWPAAKIQKLEEMLISHVRVANGKASIDEKGLDYKEILKIFGLGYSWYNPVGWFHKDDDSDTARKRSFVRWFAIRFRPVFLAWATARDHIAPMKDWSDLNELKGEQKQALLTAAHAVDANIYNNMDSPFDDPLDASPGVIETYYKQAMADAKGDKPTTTAAAAAPAGSAAAAVAARKAATGVSVSASAGASAGASASIGGLPGAVAAASAGKATASVSAGTKLTAKATAASGFFSADKLSALKAVRYRTYGLSDLETDKVRALFLLETAIMDDVRYDSDGTASFQGDIDYYFGKFAGYFGVTGDDKVAKVRWYSWFTKRLMPTLLQFASASKRANKSVNPLDADDYLSPAHLLDVANMIVASTFTQDGRSVSVWTLTDSPFDDQPLNTRSDSVKPNLDALKQAVQRRVMDEEKARQQSKRDALDAAAAKQNLANGKTADGRPRAANDADYLTRKRLESQLPTGIEAGSSAAAKFIASGGKVGEPVGASIKQPGNGTAGDINKLPVPTGTGKEAMAPLLAAVGQMTGVDPNLLSIFAGIESSWDPTAKARGSSASGLFQFVGDTWREKLGLYASKYGIDPNTSPFDPRASALMGAEFIRENQVKLAKALGRAPTDTELYLAHFLGPAGATRMLKANDNDLAVSIAGEKAGQANAPIFFRNGQPLTKAMMMKLMDSKVAKFRGGSVAQMAKAYEAPPTGGVTSTTANGAKGGVGVSDTKQLAATQAKADGSAALPAPSMPSANPTSTIAPQQSDQIPDAVSQQQQQRLQRARAEDKSARLSQQQQQQNSEVMTDHLVKQTGLLDDISKSLATMLGHTQALPDMADNLASAPSASVSANGTTANASVTQSTTVPPRPVDRMADPVINMGRKRYS